MCVFSVLTPYVCTYIYRVNLCTFFLLARGRGRGGGSLGRGDRQHPHVEAGALLARKE
mgnify:CR=1 FL=1